MKHNSIVAYKVRLEDVRKHLRAKFNDQSIEVEVPYRDRVCVLSSKDLD
ncbi:hypothetical protein FOTG_02635 [Fusarium oxysporum f. sp. vasinfectum 25433]|uniref:Uncharacterized protein n=1 Tax=Fusarium oxysporum f. sp. vasinfectum 25433 TaxID=1089449 RepID=X0MKU9_FUSOX|nr:hypothetical protein FOTG_02635 [Fusarium oxysporum f. sp. vasinfectum 25433]